MNTLNNKVAVITGAASGIGRALAQQLDAAGCRLVLSDINQDGLNSLATELRLPAQLHTADVSDRQQIENLRDAALSHYGAVDILVNNAGVAVSQSIEALSYEDFEWIMGINFWGSVYGTKAFLPHLKTRPEASIVNVSSVFGLIAVPTQGAYNATKFALRGFTEALQWELVGSGVAVTGIYPCGIKTNVAKASRFYVDPHGDTDAGRGAANFEAVATMSADACAARIVRAIQHKEKRVLVGRGSTLIDRLQRLLPNHYWPVLQRLTPSAS